MYKTSIITDEISQDLVAAAKLIKKFGLDAMEVRSVSERNPFEMDSKDFAFIHSVAGDYGLEICCVAAPVFKCVLGDEKAYHDHIEGLKRCVEAAHLWGAKLIRVFAFFNDGKGRASYPMIMDKFQPAIDIAKDAGVTLALESEPSVCTYNINERYTFLQMLSCPQVAAVLDAGNEITDLAAPPPYPTGYELLKPYIKHVHIKDMKRVKDGAVPALPGQGDVDYQGLFSRLKQDGYSGFVSLETHFRFTEALDENLLVRPQGSSFSSGGMEATEAALNIMDEQYQWRVK